MNNQIDDELEDVQEMFGDDFFELIALFKIDTPKRISDLGHAIKELDLALVKNLTHLLAGSACSMGAIKLSLLCKELEDKSTSGTTEQFDTAFTAIENEYQRIVLKLHKMVSKS